MSIAINQVNIGGNMTRDIEIIKAGETSIGKTSLAITEQKKQKDGTWGKDTQFIDITMFGRLAERCAENLKKGDAIYVSGRLCTDKWQDSDGKPRTKVYAIANDVRYLRWGKDRTAAGSAQQEEPEEVSPF